MDILDRYNRAVIFSVEAETTRRLLQEAIRAEANLHGVHAQSNGHDVLRITGLPYQILITDTHLQAGCETHTFAAWRNMTAEQVAKMDGRKATNFYPTLLRIMDLFCKDREAGA